MHRMTLFCLLGLAACADFPRIDGTLDAAARDAPFPSLIDIRPVLATAAVAHATPPASLDARITALNDRAARLRSTTVADPALRAALQSSPLR